MASVSSATSTSTSAYSSSSIDWSSLIEVAVQAKLTRADSIDVKVTNNGTKIAAYTSMQSLLSTMQKAAQALRAPSGTSLKTTDIFNSRTAYLSANGNVDAASTVSATVESGAEIGSFDLTVSKLAKTHKIAGTATSSKTEDLAYSGVISLGTVGGTSSDISITATMSLAEIAEAINNESAATGVQASVLQVSASQFRLILSTTATGQTISASAVAGDDVLSALGITDSSGAFANVLQESSQAVFSVDGVEITRSTNDISDVVSGVTLHLYQTTAADTSITVEVGTDLSAVKSAVTALVDAYNAYRAFAYTQQQIPSDKTSADSILFGDGTLRNVNASVNTALTTMISSLSIANIGLSFDSYNNLVIDDDVLDDALLTKLSSVKSLLSFQMTSSSTELLLLNRGTATPADFALDVTVAADGSLSAASVGGDTSLFTVNGSRISGAAGTKYEGYTFVFTGSASKTINVSFSTGIAELLYNVANKAANTSTGTLAGLIDNMASTNDTLQAKSDDIRTRAETYRTNLSARYAKLQAAIAAAEASQSYLTTLLDTWNSSS